MSKLTPNPVPRPAQRPLTQEEKQMRIMQFLQQKREQFAINILCNMTQGAITNKGVTNYDCKCLVDLAVEMADKLLEKLYPTKESEDSKESEKSDNN